MAKITPPSSVANWPKPRWLYQMVPHTSRMPPSGYLQRRNLSNRRSPTANAVRPDLRPVRKAFDPKHETYDDEACSYNRLCGNLCCSRSLRGGVCRFRPFRLERLWHERQCHCAVRARGLLAGARIFHRLLLCPRSVLRRMGAHSLHFFSPSKGRRWSCRGWYHSGRCAHGGWLFSDRLLRLTDAGRIREPLR
jgi:hypothetical protein